MGQSINSSQHNYCVIYFGDLFSLANTVLKSETVLYFFKSMTKSEWKGEGVAC